MPIKKSIRRKQRGEGFFGNLIKTAVKHVAPVILDEASRAAVGLAKKRISGMGVRSAGVGRGLRLAGRKKSR